MANENEKCPPQINRTGTATETAARAVEEFGQRDRTSRSVAEQIAAALPTAEKGYAEAPLAGHSRFEVHFADPFHLSAQPFMRCWMAWAKTSRGMYYATVGLPVIEEREISELGSDVHREWMNMNRATLGFRLARNVMKTRNRINGDLQEVIFEE